LISALFLATLMGSGAFTRTRAVDAVLLLATGVLIGATLVQLVVFAFVPRAGQAAQAKRS
jgi:hypothetical protein